MARSPYNDPFTPSKAKHQLGKQSERILMREQRRRAEELARVVAKMKELERHRRRWRSDPGPLVTSATAPDHGIFTITTTNSGSNTY